MPYDMKNAGSCALSSDTIYVFGGKTLCQETSVLKFSDYIFLYLVSANRWVELALRMPVGLGLTTSIKINNSQIALFGGLR